LMHEGIITSVGPPAVDAVDAAGAGDALAGTYLAWRAAGYVPGDALRAGVAASALSVTQRGCSLSYPSRVQVETALAEMPPVATSPR
jgi:2-dehydro-3-deoxygluconokinase